MRKLLDSLSNLATLLEAVLGKKEFLARLVKLGWARSGAALDAYNDLASYDPTPTKKYMAWILFMLERGEGKYSITAVLARFIKSLPYLDEKDIYLYRSVQAAEDAIKIAEKKLADERAAKAVPSSKLVSAKNGYKIYSITTVENLVSASQNTHWCTRGEPTAENYLERGIRFYLIFKGADKYAMLVFNLVEAGAATVFNLADQQVFNVDLELIDALDFLPFADVLSLIRGKIVARKDLPASFADQLDDLNEYESQFANDPEEAFYHMVDHGIFPAGTAIVSLYPKWAYLYADSILHGEFPEGEEAIATSPLYSFHYANLIGPFPQGEAAIKKDGPLAVKYAMKILGLHVDQAQEWAAAPSYLYYSAELDDD